MKIHITKDGQQYGPFTLAQVNTALAGGELSPDDLAWHEGLTEWIILAAVDGVVAPHPSRSMPPPPPGATEHSTPGLKTASTAQPSVTLYTKGQIWGASFLGGPLAGIWMCAHNCRQFGQPSSATRWLLGGSIGTIALLCLLSFVTDARSLASLVPLTVSLALAHWADQMHGKLVTQHVSAGGRIASGWKVAGITLASMSIIILANLVIIFLDTKAK